MRRILGNIEDAVIRNELEEIWKRLGYTESKTAEPTTSTLAPGEMAVYSGVLYFNDAGTIRKVTVDSGDAAYLKADGSVDLTGNLSVDSGVTIDGVDIGAHAANASAHHTKYTDAEAVIAAKTVKLDDFTAADDNTDLNASTSAHGLLLKGDNDTTHFLRGDVSWAAPDHGAIGGLSDDDHSQYLNVTRHDADDHSGLLPLDHGSDVDGLSDDDHTQYFNSTRHDADDHDVSFGTIVCNDGDVVVSDGEIVWAS